MFRDVKGRTESECQSDQIDREGRGAAKMTSVEDEKALKAAGGLNGLYRVGILEEVDLQFGVETLCMG